MKYNLTITDRAEELLDHILYYIVNQLKNPQAAVNLMNEIEHVYIVGFFHNLELYRNKL